MVKKHWIPGHLNDVIDSLVAGVSVNSGEDDTSGNFFILKTSAISKGKLNLSEKKPVLPREVARLKCSLRQETILISRMNTPELVGECAYVPCDDPQIYLPDRIWQTNFKKDVDVSAKWLNYLLSSKKYRSLIQNCATGTSNSMKNISKEQLLGLEILYPSFREQTSIAEALSDIDSLISSLQKLIEKKKAIKQGAMQELLTGKKRLPGFCLKWTKRYLKEIIVPRKERINPAEIDNRRCIELEHIEPNSGKILGYCESKEQKSLKTIFYPNDILWGKLRPYLRKYAHPKFSGVCSTEFWVFNAINQYACNDFMYYLLQTEDFVSAANSTTGTKMPRADWNLVQELEVKIPTDKNEQRAIAQVLSDMDSEIEQLEKKLAKYQQIKQGMMQELLTGRIRLKIGEMNV